MIEMTILIIATTVLFGVSMLVANITLAVRTEAYLKTQRKNNDS